MGEKKMRILIVDNLANEREQGVAAVVAAGHEAVVANGIIEALDLIPEVDAIVTDLFMPPGRRLGDEAEKAYATAEPAMGLLVAMSAIAAGKPVAICTDCNHHGEKAAWIFDAYFMQLVNKGRTCPFDWHETYEAEDGNLYKDWPNAVKFVSS